MRKKFSREDNNNFDEVSVSKHDMHTTLLDYIGSFAHEILKSQPFMKNKYPLDFWTQLFHHCQQGEEKRLEKDSIKWGYAVRIALFARKFLSLTEQEQKYILSANEDKVKWRGDDMKEFYRIARATLDHYDLSEKEKDNYRKNAMSMAMNIKNAYK